MWECIHLLIIKKEKQTDFNSSDLIQEKEGQQSTIEKEQVHSPSLSLALIFLSISIMTISRRSIIVYSCMFIEVTKSRK